MAPVLVHTARAFGKPTGVWRIEHDKLVCEYDLTAPLEHVIRARVALAAKGDTVPIDAWFRQLASKVPYADDYEVIDADPAADLHDILIQAQTAWTDPA